MNVFLLPVTLTNELQKMMNFFWWGSKSNGSKGITGCLGINYVLIRRLEVLVSEIDEF